jgi:predicted transcriptional regulator
MKPFSYSQSLLAFSIAFLAFSLLKIAIEIPSIVKVIDKSTTTVDNISPQIPDIVSSVKLINEQIPEIVAEVAEVRKMLDRQVPNVLEQVNLIRPVISSAVDQSNQYVEQLPDLFNHLEKIEQQINAIQAAIPSILQRVDAVVITTKNTTEEIALWRPHSTEYIKQIEYSRTDIPNYLTRAEGIVYEAKTIGKEASSGLFVGLLKGAVRLPFDVISGLTNIVDSNSRSAKNFSAQDIAILQENTITLLDNEDSFKTIWQNKESGNRGVIKKSKKFNKKGKTCHQLDFDNYFKKGQEKLSEVMCLDNKAVWQVMPDDF